MTRLFRLILIAFLLGCTPDAPPPQAVREGSPLLSLSTPIAASHDLYISNLQAKLDALPRGDGLPRALVPIGGRIEIAKGAIVYTKSINLDSAQWLDGAGSAATLLDYRGASGTSAITIHARNGQGYAVRPRVSHLSIRCAPGTKAIANDDSAPYTLDAMVDDVIVTGGPIALIGECYFATLSDVSLEDGAGIQWRGTGLTCDSLKTQPNTDTSANGRRAVIDILGTVNFTGYCRLEGKAPIPYLRVADTSYLSGGHLDGRAHFDGAHHLEPHRPGPFITADKSDVFMDEVLIGGDSSTPMVLTGSHLYLRSASHPEYVQQRIRWDAASTVYVAGQQAQQPVSTSRPSH